MCRLVPLVYAASILLASGIVRAHSDPAMFAEPTELGGSGGRYFTGSPQDGLGCSVCHSGGTVPRVVLEGLPTAYEPGTRAMVTVSWEQPEVSHALALEIVDDEGRDAALELLDADALPAETRCDGDPEGAPAAWLVELSPRRVLVVQDCGARAVSFAFTAPEARALSFAAAVVRSDSSATAQGDGVLEVRETIWRDGAQPSGCALGLSPSPGPMALLLALLFVRRRRGLSGIRRRTWR
jgi:hypothetical protein